MDRFGGWWRPWNYGDFLDEYWAVREGVSLGDVSTLGKMIVSGPDVVEALERIYPTTVHDIRPGRSRYVLLLNERGHLIDDGMVCREPVEAKAAIGSCSPSRRAAHRSPRPGSATGSSRGDSTSTFSTARWRSARSTSPGPWPPSSFAASGSTIRRASCNTSTPMLPEFRAMCCGLSFTGEASFELHHPRTHSVELWQALMAAGSDLGVRPHGLQALFALRLEKGHVIVGMDTEMDSTPRRLGMDWAVKLDKARLHRPHGAAAHRRPRRPSSPVRHDHGRTGARRGSADLGRWRDRRSCHVELPVAGPGQDRDARLAEAHAVRRHA